MLTLITYIQARLATLESDERGATAVEYGLMVSLIAGVIIVAVTALGVKLDGVFNNVTGLIK
jgi:pilus assembly protein Flp/PilA